MGQTETSIVLLLEGLKRQQECVRQLAGLCEDQRRLVADGNAEGLLRLLGRRQGLIREMEDAERTLAPFKSGWPNSRDRLPAPQRPGIEQMLSEIEDCLQRIIQQDEDDYRRLAEAKQAVGAQIRQAAAGRQVNAAYSAARRPAGGLLPAGETA
jgi:hypothetical protein